MWEVAVCFTYSSVMAPYSIRPGMAAARAMAKPAKEEDVGKGHQIQPAAARLVHNVEDEGENPKRHGEEDEHGVDGVPEHVRLGRHGAWRGVVLRLAGVGRSGWEIRKGVRIERQIDWMQGERTRT